MNGITDIILAHYTHTKSVPLEHKLTDLVRSSRNDFDFLFHVSFDYRHSILPSR